MTRQLKPQVIDEISSPNGHERSLRVMTFADRDDCVLIFTPPGTDVPPVRITHPITVVSMKAALREAGVPNNKIRVSSTTYVGRMGPVIQQVKQQEQA